MKFNKNKFLGHPFTPKELIEAILEQEKIKMFEGKPKRDSSINYDDIINLRIALNTSSSIEDFNKKV